VMPGWRALMGIPNGRGFSPNAKGFFIEQCSCLPNKDFLQILRQGARVYAYSARVKVPECVQGSEGSHVQIEGKSSRDKCRRLNFIFIAKIPTSLVQTNQKACSAQTRDEWNRQWHRRGRRGAPG
jgi:hypothetical protein